MQHEVLLVPLGSSLHGSRCYKSSLRESNVLSKDLVSLRSIQSVHHGVEKFGSFFNSTERSCASNSASAHLRNGILEVFP